MEKQDKIRLLTEKINTLEAKFQTEIQVLRGEIEVLKLESNSKETERQDFAEEKIDAVVQDVLEERILEKQKILTKEEATPVEDKGIIEKEPIFSFKQESHTKQKPQKDFNLEDYIGGNLISRIGIGVLIIGIGIFIKYTIDENMISPIGRLAIAYSVGAALLGLSYWLRSKYKTYSAVLFGGGTATLYFTSYLGHLFFELPPQLPAFILMLLITVYTVWEAIRYDEEIIGIVGLVGAYAVPILLSKGGGKVEVLFIYMTIINVGVMILAFRKTWDRMSLVAFINTWLVFMAWYSASYVASEHFMISITFLLISFLIFYASLVTHHIKSRTEFSEIKLILVASNTLLFYGFMWAILADLKELDFSDGYTQATLHKLVLFNLAHAVFQASIAFYLFKENLQKNTLFSVVSALSIASLTVAVPLYFDSNWTTILWLTEGFLIFALARQKSVRLVSLELKSYAVLVLTLLSLVYNWQTDYALTPDSVQKAIFLNMSFLMSWLVTVGVLALIYISVYYKNQEEEKSKDHIVKYTLLTDLQQHITKYLSVLLLVLIYFSIFLEINYYFKFQYYEMINDKVVKTSIYNNPFLYFNTVWLLIYSAIYLSTLALVSTFLLKQRLLQNIALVGSLVFMFLFISTGFNNMHGLIALRLGNTTIFSANAFFINIRYLAYLSAVILIVSFFLLIRKEARYREERIKIYQAILNIFILAILSFELSNWFVLQSNGTENAILEARTFAAKMPFTLLWGSYAFALIVFGIWKKRRYLRFTGFGILGLTLAKLFIRDINYNSNLSLILAFIGLGILLLTIAFLYQKYKDVILGEDEE